MSGSIVFTNQPTPNTWLLRLLPTKAGRAARHCRRYCRKYGCTPLQHANRFAHVDPATGESKYLGENRWEPGWDIWKDGEREY
jgi:hypothetical protein